MDALIALTALLFKSLAPIMALPLTVRAESVPTLVSEELTTLDPRVVALRTSV